MPDGSKFYVISASGSQTVTSSDATFQNPKSLGNLGTAATAAVLSPDGKKLLVAAGTLHIFDTTTDTDLTPSGILPGTPIVDVAVSLDSRRAFVLGTLPSGQGVLYAIDLTSSNFATVGNLPLNNLTSSVAVGPNGLVYVAAVNRIYEINPATLLLTPSGEIGTLIRSVHLAFTPDGKYLLATNQSTGQTQASVILVDLTTHTVAGQSLSTGNGSIDSLIALSNTMALAYSKTTASAYLLTIPSLTISNASFSGGPTQNISAVAVSNEVPGGSRTSAQSVYLVSGGTLYRIDIPTNQVTQTIPATTVNPGGLAITGIAPPPASPVTLLQYGNNQALAQGAQSLPIVVRVLDSNGLPIFGAPVTFATASNGVGIQNATVLSGIDGYAQTTFSAPASSGPVVITATAGSATVNFNATIGTGTGTGGQPTGGLAIVAGQGQLIFENNNTGIPGFGSPLTVRVTDINGAPVANANVTFSLAQGFGTLAAYCGPTVNSCPPSQPTPDGSGIIVTTDANGIALASFLSTTIPPASGFTQTTVQAVAPGTNSVNFYVSTTSRNNPPTVQYIQPLPGSSITGGAGSTQKGAIVVAVVSSLGTAIPNVSIRLIDPSTSNGDPTTAPNSQFASCADPSGLGVLTDATGKGTCDLVLTGKVGTGVQFSVDVGNHFASQPYNLTVTPGMPANVNIVQGNNQTGNVGQQLPLAFAVQVTDAAGNLLTGAPVNFQVVTPGSIKLLNISAATDQNGRASALGVLGSIGGTYQVKVTAGTGSASFTFMVNIPASGIQPVSGGNQTTTTNTAFASPVIVRAVNSTGGPVAGLQVTFQVTGGTASVSNPTVTTDANGLAQTSVTAGGNPGPITVTASAAGFSTSFQLQIQLPGPTNVVFLNGASFQPGISPGSIAIIRGNGLLPGVQGVVTPTSVIGPAPTNLAGFSATFNGVPAPLLYVSNQAGQEQIGLQVPFEVTPGTATVVLNAPGGGTTTLTVPIQPVAPGLFETIYNGQNFLVATRPNGTYVSPTNPAVRGEVDCAFAAGLGQTTPPLSTGGAGVANEAPLDPIDFGLNNGGVRVVSTAAVVGQLGLFQICFQVPSDTTPGPRQPVGLIVHDPAGDFFAQGSFIPIQ